MSHDARRLLACQGVVLLGAALVGSVALSGCGSAPSPGPAPGGMLPTFEPLSLGQVRRPHALAGGPRTDQMVIVCWDGAQRNHVNTAMRHGELPNLARLVAAGGSAETLITDHATETKAAHAEMLCGYGPDVTGNVNAKKFAPVARELTIFNRLNRFYGRDRILGIWLTSKDQRLSSHPGETFQYMRFEVDRWEGDVHRMPEVTQRDLLSTVEACLRPGQRFLCFLHFATPDDVGHSSGENSRAYHRSLLELDGYLGEMLAKLEEVGVGQTCAVCVVADHGFDEGGARHRSSPDAWLATDLGPLRPSGDQKDLAPTILAAFGLDPASYQPPMPGSPLWAD